MKTIGALALLMMMLLAVCGALPLQYASSRNLMAGKVFATNEYEYAVQRDQMEAEEAAYEGHNISSLNADERIVNNYLEYLKWREFNATRLTGFPPSRPIEEKLNYIRSTEVYAALKKLPKGGNMHSHEDHELSKRQLLEIIRNSTEYEYLYMLPEDHPTDPWKLDFFVNPPTTSPAWIKVKDSTKYSFESILAHQTLMGILTDTATRYPTDSERRWAEINPLWGRGSTQLVANYNIKFKYLEAIYQHGLNEGVTYYEARKNFGPAERLYVMDPSGANNATNGKKFLDQGGDLEVDTTLKLVENFTRDHPEFIGHRRISYTHRMGGIEGSFKSEMDNVERLNKKYPDHVMGFDTVGQEDAGNSLLFYLERFVKTGSSLPLFLHTTETSWPDDLLSSINSYDPLSTPQNALDTMLLMSKRLGHATGFIKHPYRVELVKQRGIAIESCPVSNQMLGYVPDLRQHPALNYYRSGIPLILGADDPGTMGYDDFTVDWYEVYNAWGLDLSDLKKLAENSLRYSTMQEADKKTAVESKWRPLWDKYIADMKTVACARDFTAAAGPLSFGRILPREGANNDVTRVHVYGRNFERAICKPAKCRFGSKETLATLIDTTHLVCEAPKPDNTDLLTVDVAVALDGVNFVKISETFTYKYSSITA